MLANSAESGKRRPRVLGLACAFALAGAVLIVTACENSEKDTLLEPPGGTSELSGVLTFDGSGGPDLPEATIYALSGYDESCVTSFSTMHLLGTFNAWNTELWTTTPGMTYLGGCVWTEEVAFESGEIQWKFVSDAGWNDNDYVTAGEEGLQGSVQLGGGGEETNLVAQIPETGDYHVLLFEGTTPPSYLIGAGADAPVVRSNVATGAFSIANLPAGTYEIIIRAEGYLDAHVAQVVLDGKQGRDLGTIDVVSATGAILGRVAFADSPSPLPTATVQIYQAGGTTVVRTDSTDALGDFAIRGLSTGSYDVRISAEGYEDETVAGVDFVNGEDSDLGTITLSPGCSSAYSFIEVLGEFNGWSPTGRMTQVEACLWQDTLTVAVTGDSADLRMKFRTDGVWDTPPDFGTCTSQSDVLPLVGGAVEDTVCLVTGEGTALTVRFYETGDYEFRLDEQHRTFRIALLEEVLLGTIAGTVAYADSPADPPAATIKVYPDGSSEIAAQTSAASGGAFSVSVAAGIYDLTVEASGYDTEGVENVTVVGNETTNVGTVELAVSVVCTPSLRIEVWGDFNNWSGPPATLVGECTWADTLNIGVGGDADSTYIFKFRTDGSWDPDYGSCQSYGGENYLFEFTGYEVTGTVCLVSGTGTGIKVKFPADASYRFELDEATKAFRIVQLVR